MRRTVIISVLFLSLLKITTAGTIELPPVDQGWYISDGYHVGGHKNYVAEQVGQTEWRNFFVFDLSGVNSQIESASLQLFTWEISGSATYQLQEYGNSGLDINKLMRGHSKGSSEGKRIFNDLGTGIDYGSIYLNPSNTNTIISIPLNQSALDKINSSEGLIAFGGKHLGLNSWEALFGNSDIHSANKLILTAVPEPATLLLFGLGGLVLGRRKAKLLSQ